MAFELPTGGNVIGVGLDIADIARIQKSIERHGERFLNRIYTEGEQAYCREFKNPYPGYTARFAAKEAVSKAFSTGIGEHLGWKSMEIIKGERNQPLLKLDTQGAALLKDIGGTDVLISLSHTSELATAIAVIVR